MLVELLRPLLAPLLLRLPQPDLRVNRLDLRVLDLPPKLAGLTIAHISDLHVGEGSWLPRHVDEAAGVVRDARPDLIVNTGDFIRHHPPLDRVLDCARRFCVPGIPHLAVLGNHDYYAGEEEVDQLISGLLESGIRVLQNEVSDLVLRETRLTVAGLTGNAAGFDGALAEFSTRPHPRICLLHEPDLGQDLPARSVDLVLAGHTHGGQITVPLITPLIVRRFSHSDCVAGLYSVRGNPVYVNSGLGFTGLPLRVGASPEVALIRLTL